jgi:hypothetical protein
MLFLPLHAGGRCHDRLFILATDNSALFLYVKHIFYLFSLEIIFFRFNMGLSNYL